jgi:hypothetical protein
LFNSKGDFMNRATWLAVICCVLSACDLGAESAPITTQVVNIGLQAQDVPVPPKGFGVAPIIGYPGPTPASVPAASVGANGPGSLSLYGGQWIVPLPVQPGAKILNASCDFISNSSTIATVELVGRSGTITSKTFGPAAGVNLTLWLVPTDADPNGYTVGDGEHVVIRTSFRDSVTGAWTSGAQQVPMLSCAVNASGPRIVHTYKISPLSGVNVGTGSFPVQGGTLTGCWQPSNAGDLLGVSLQLEAGDRLESATASVYGNSGYIITMSLLEDDDAFHVASDFVHATSTATNTLQTVSITWGEDVTMSQRNYALQFRANKIATSEGLPIVGPITLTISH